jgi:imidazolonepropionase-like amidohydrolase
MAKQKCWQLPDRTSGQAPRSSSWQPTAVSQFTDSELAAAAFVSESFGSYFMVHAYYDNAVSRAIEFGAGSIEHGHLMSEKAVRQMSREGVFLVVEALMSTAEAPPSFTADQRQKFELMKSGFVKMIELAKKHDLKIAFGSDVFLSKDSYALQAQEWVARSELFSPVENLRHATSIGGELLVLLIDGEPLSDITILADPDNNLRLIMKDGVIYKNTL